jgi:hypothetical protein
VCKSWFILNRFQSDNQALMNKLCEQQVEQELQRREKLAPTAFSTLLPHPVGYRKEAAQGGWPNESAADMWLGANDNDGSGSGGRVSGKKDDAAADGGVKSLWGAWGDSGIEWRGIGGNQQGSSGWFNMCEPSCSAQQVSGMVVKDGSGAEALHGRRDPDGFYSTGVCVRARVHVLKLFHVCPHL